MVGALKCQGVMQCTRVHDAAAGTFTGTVHVGDVDAIARGDNDVWEGEAVVHAHRTAA